MSDFHRSKKSAAVLKHAIIDSYATPFASKTGVNAVGKRVAFIDGYAGPGRYADGEEGSGAMLLRKARELAALPRHLECHFVESDPETIARLREVAAKEGEDVNYTIYDGDISSHLPRLLQAARGIPLFVYLDPCGLIIPMDEVATIFQRPQGLGAPATEVLINLTAHLRRFAGMLYSETPVEASLQRIDEVCGGPWWRETWLASCPAKISTEDQKMAAELAVVEGYAARLSERAGGAGTWIIDVRPRAGLKPVYYLVFATRHNDGMVAFGESTSLGLERWRKHNAEMAAEDDLFGQAADWETEWKAEEARMKATWIATLEERLERELKKGQSFRIMDKSDEILGIDLAGVVRGTHFRAALKNLFIAGKTSTSPVKVTDFYHLVISPPR